jgi:hypothetical protein
MSTSDENIGKVHQAVLEDHRWTINEISEIRGVSWSLCQHIFVEDSMMEQVAAKFVAHLLTEEA